MTSFSSINGRRCRIALVGCGRISRNHIKAIAIHHELAELVALCDTEQERLDNAQEFVVEAAQENPKAAKCPVEFLGYDNLVAAVKANDLVVDLVVLTTPSGLHSAQTIAAAELGLNVCTEKPMATCWEDGVAMVKACEKANVQLFVVKQNRFNSTLQLVKKQLEAGRFGQLAMVSVNVFWQRPQSYYDQDNWRGTWAMDGGALMNQASHYVDLLDYLVGPIDYVSASTATLGRTIEAEDTAAIQLKWKNGALGTMSVTMLTYPRNLEGSITLLGEKGSVKVGGTAVNKIDYWHFTDTHPDDELVKDASYDINSIYGFGHVAYYKNMIDSLSGNDTPICNGNQGLRSLELLIASYYSADKHKYVYLPLPENFSLE